MIEMVLPEPRDLSHHLSRSAKARQASAIKKFYKFFAIKGIGQLAGGMKINGASQKSPRNSLSISF
ncbi:MAG: hypothetical protein INR71_12010 [Terriglobus roseus]|nr:hypothetical protein [Terriglobus roseus]